MAAAPNSFKDPYWSDLASGVEQKLELPKGLLVAIVNRGERSNADQVSEAGAKTVFQIIPQTREAVLKKYGVDAYLSPENAAEVAGLLLKESLQRNKGDAALATAEYHGGTDRANWGPRTRAYVQRVVGAQPQGVRDAAPASTEELPSTTPGQSTFQRALARQQAAAPATTAIANVFKAYESGQMSPEDAQQFEADVQAGTMMLPRGAKLKAAAAPAEASAPAGSGGAMLPQGVAQAYASGTMPAEDRIQLEADVAAGLVRMPDGVAVGKTERPGIASRVIEAVTGSQRATQQTQGLPDWATMPELNSFSLASAKTGLGTLLSNPQETVQIIKANFPGVQVGQDDKGNFLLTSSIDGQQYAIKPGFQPSDIPRAAGAVAAFTPAGRATSIVGAGAAAAGTQAAIEASQGATGGEFSGKEVALAGLAGAAVPAVVNTVRAGAAALRPAPAAAVRETALAAPGTPAGAVVPESVPVVAPATPPVTPAAPAVPQLAADELGQQMRTAALGGLGSKKAKQAVAEAAAPDAQTVEAAKRLGIEEHLQPDHVTTNQAFRQLTQLVKSQTGSQAAVAQREGLEKVAERANALVDEIGGTADASTLSASVRTRMESTQRELEARANKLYDDVREAVPATTGAPARNVLEFVEQRAKDLGGRQNLSPMEKQIVAKLEPKAATGGKVQPTYALLDDVRKDLGAAARAAGPFKDADTGLAKKLYSLLSDDQAAVVERLGVKETYDAARSAVAVRKGLEDDMASIFGKQLDRSMVPLLTGSVKKLGAGDTSSFVKLIGAVPPEMRQQVTASGLSGFFQRTARGGEMDFGGYAKWYEALQQNQQAYGALMANLPRHSAQQLADLARVARGIAMAKGEFIATGKAINPKVLEAADSLMGRVYEEVKRRGIAGVAAEAIGTGAGAPGLASALGSATMASKPSIVQAADRLIVSPEFVAAARAAGSKQEPAAVRALAYSKPFTRFVRAIGQPRELSNRERWLQQALQAQRSTSQEP